MQHHSCMMPEHSTSRTTELQGGYGTDESIIRACGLMLEVDQSQLSVIVTAL